jgi:hypothetical protein
MGYTNDNLRREVTMKKATSKKPAAKKPAAKKTAAVKTKKPAKKASPSKAAMPPSIQARIKKLHELVTGLEERDLDFLIEQAGVLIHNRDVDRIIQEQRKLGEPSRGKSREELDAPHLKNAAVEEGKEGNHFIILMRNYRNFFSRDEMKKVVRICQSAGDAREATRGLFGWFQASRLDVINNSMLSGGNDPILERIYDIIVSTYTTK